MADVWTLLYRVVGYYYLAVVYQKMIKYSVGSFDLERVHASYVTNRSRMEIDVVLKLRLIITPWSLSLCERQHKHVKLSVVYFSRIIPHSGDAYFARNKIYRNRFLISNSTEICSDVYTSVCNAVKSYGSYLHRGMMYGWPRVYVFVCCTHNIV